MIEKRFIVNAVDLTVVRFECTNPKCRATATVRVAEFSHPPTHCPGCHTAWISPRLMTEEEKRRDFVVRELVRTLRGLATMAGDPDTPFRIRLELDHDAIPGAALEEKQRAQM